MSEYPTPLKAIRLHCLYCSKDQPSEVRACPATKCPSWKYRCGIPKGADRVSRLKIIRAQCLDCVGGGFQPSLVKDCDHEDCSLWIYRMGHGLRHGKNPTGIPVFRQNARCSARFGTSTGLLDF